MKRIMQSIQWFMIAIKVIKSDGKRYKSGDYHCDGINMKNPISYVFCLILCVVYLGVGIIESQEEFFKEMKIQFSKRR